MADTIYVALLVWRSLVLSEESLLPSHGFPSGSSLHANRNLFSFPRGSFVVDADSSLCVDAVLSVSGDRKVSSVIFNWLNVSAISYTERSLLLSSGDDILPL